MNNFECYRCKFNTKNKKDIDRHFRLNKCKPKYSDIDINDYKDYTLKGLSVNDYINQSINNKNKKPIQLLLNHISVLNNKLLKQNILIRNIEDFYENQYNNTDTDTDDELEQKLQDKINKIRKYIN